MESYICSTYKCTVAGVMNDRCPVCGQNHLAEAPVARAVKQAEPKPEPKPEPASVESPKAKTVKLADIAKAAVAKVTKKDKKK